MNDAVRRGGGLQMTFRANLRPSPGEKPVNCRVKVQCLQPGVQMDLGCHVLFC